MLSVIRIVLVALLSLAACICDIKSYKIPNRIVVIGLLAAVLLAITDICLGQGNIEVWYCFAGIFFGLFVVYCIGGIGAGDVKLLSVIGLLLGRYAVYITLGSFFAALPLGMAEVLLKKAKRKRVTYGSFCIEGHVMHYSVAILLSECMVLCMCIARQNGMAFFVG